MKKNALPLSVHVLTWNSGKTLRRCLKSVGDVAEILIVDGGSTDDTLKIAKEFGATVIPQREKKDQGKPIADFSAVRNKALEAATLPWTLALDSDEAASKELMNDIRRIIGANDVGAYAVPRRYELPDGRLVTRATTYPNRRVYFFHRDAVLGWKKPVHERVALRSDVRPGILKGWTIAPIGTPAEFKEKNKRYLEIDATKKRGWFGWLRHVLRTLRGRITATLKLCRIWLVPGRGTRLPLKYERLRYWYAWRSIVTSAPWRRR